MEASLLITKITNKYNARTCFKCSAAMFFYPTCPNWIVNPLFKS